MKHFGLPAFVVFSVLWFSSCKKCTSCEVRDSAGNSIQPAKKTCGSASEINAAKENASAKSVLIGGAYTCTDE